MPAKNAERMTSLREHPRVRPALWLLLPVFIGAAILEVGARRAWFVGALGSETYPQLKFALTWAALGLAFSVLATLAWHGIVRSPRRWTVWLGALQVFVFLIVASQIAAHHASKQLVLVIDGIRWDDEAKVFRLHAMAVPGVARAYEQGRLGASGSVESWPRGRTTGVRLPRRNWFAQPIVRRLREETATPPSARPDSTELVELGWIPAHWSLASGSLQCVMNLSSSREALMYVPLAAKVTLVNRAQQPVGRTAGAAFLLPYGIQRHSGSDGFRELLMQVLSATPPYEQEE